jgi:rRNA-processing protein FCF1
MHKYSVRVIINFMLFEKSHSSPICQIMKILFAENCQQRSHTHISVVATALQQCNTHANCLFIPQCVVREANDILRHHNYNFSNWLREYLFSNKRVNHRVEQYTHTYANHSSTELYSCSRLYGNYVLVNQIYAT